MSTAVATKTAQTTVSVGTSSGAFLSESPNRIAVIISPGKSFQCTLSLEGTAVLGEGINLYGGNEPVILTQESVGELVTRRWSAISEDAQDITVLEVFAVR